MEIRYFPDSKTLEIQFRPYRTDEDIETHDAEPSGNVLMETNPEGEIVVLTIQNAEGVVDLETIRVDASLEGKVQIERP